MADGSATPILRLDGVQTHIGPYHILHGVSFPVPRGGVTMLLGRNGAGKTTTLRTVMNLWQASEGRIMFDGADITRRGTPAIAQAGIAYVPENMSVFSELTVAENMRLAARGGAIDGQRLDWVLRMFPALKIFWYQRAGVLSGGQKQMLSVARAIIEPRKLLIVDEPTDVSILLVEQNFHMAKSVGDTVAVMDDGRVVHTGSMAELAGDEALQQRLLGLSLAAHQ
jgi:branched-chain amino acid transport system ATP-binding protein